MEYLQKQGHYIKPLEERPLVDSGNEWIWVAFNRLGSTRSSAGFGQGRISYLSMTQYCREMEMSTNDREFLWDVIQKLDGVFLKRIADKSKPPPKPNPGR